MNKDLFYRSFELDRGLVDEETRSVPLSFSSEEPVNRWFGKEMTGGSSGIGKAIALAFAKEGADVAIGYLKSETGARDAVDKIMAMGRQALMIQADVTQESEVVHMIEKTIQA